MVENLSDENPCKLFHNDCLNIISEIKDGTIDLIVTDPPYGISYKSGRQKVDRKKSVKGEGSIQCREDYFDGIEEDDHLNIKWLSNAYRILKNNSAMYIFTHWKAWSELYNGVIENGFSVNNMIVLNKSNHGMGNLKHYAPKHELIMFATKGRHEMLFPFGREEDIWNVPVKFSGSRKFHPNEKPLTWLTPAIANSSIAGDIVFDPFMGSGTTGIASVGMDRKFIGCEKNKEYFDISASRIDQAITKRQSNIL